MPCWYRQRAGAWWIVKCITMWLVVLIGGAAACILCRGLGVVILPTYHMCDHIWGVGDCLGKHLCVNIGCLVPHMFIPRVRTLRSASKCLMARRNLLMTRWNFLVTRWEFLVAIVGFGASSCAHINSNPVCEMCRRNYAVARQKPERCIKTLRRGKKLVAR